MRLVYDLVRCESHQHVLGFEIGVDNLADGVEVVEANQTLASDLAAQVDGDLLKLCLRPCTHIS